MDSIAKRIPHYHIVHRWLKKMYGKAHKCEFGNCTQPSKRYEWAVLKGKAYEKERSNFVMLCPSCHRKYDDTPERRKKISDSNKGNVCHNASKAVYKITKNGEVIDTYVSVAQAARSNSVSHGNIWRVIRGGRKTAAGYFWKLLPTANNKRATSAL